MNLLKDTLIVTDPTPGDNFVSVYSTLLDVTIITEINGCKKVKINSQNYDEIKLTEGVAVKNARISGSGSVNELGDIALSLSVVGTIEGSPINPITAPVVGDFVKQP